jgi:hypothetical protein
LIESIRKDAKGCSLHGVARQATPKPMNGSLEESGRNGRQGSSQRKNASHKKALMDFKKNFSLERCNRGAVEKELP